MKEAWEALKFFVGSWEASERGKPGVGRGERTYQYVLRGAFLEVRNTSTWEPTERHPTGEVHEDWGLYSYDGQRDLVVLRQFHVEGFVNQYALRPAASGRTFVFETEQIENLPRDWRARETLRILSDDEFEEVFELAAPGKDFEVYIESRHERRPTP